MLLKKNGMAAPNSTKLVADCKVKLFLEKLLDGVECEMLKV